MSLTQYSWNVAFGNTAMDKFDGTQFFEIFWQSMIFFKEKYDENVCLRN